MAYAQIFTFNFGAGNNGKTLNAGLYDTSGSLLGSTITSGFVDLGGGLYSYLHSALPSATRCTLKAWIPADPDLGAIGLAVNPEQAESITDILSYVQNISVLQSSSSSGGSGSSEDTTGVPVGSYLVEPADFRMITVEQLISDLMERVTEPVFKEDMARRAIKSAIMEEDHRPAVALSFVQEFTEDVCDYPSPCSGLRVLGVEGMYGECEDCYSDISYTVHHNRILLPYAFDGTGRITVAVPNRYTENQETVALAIEVDGLTHLYISGQPEIPGSGIVQICGDPWVYAYKGGVSFVSATVNSATSIDSEDGYASIGSPLPDGKHTILYAQRLSNCGRLPESEIAFQMTGAKVSWPIIYRDGTHREYLLHLAMSKAYALLINSSRSDKDVQRFSVLQKHWQDEAARIFLKMPRLRNARARKQTVNLDHYTFTPNPLYPGQPGPYAGRYARVTSGWE